MAVFLTKIGGNTASRHSIIMAAEGGQKQKKTGGGGGGDGDAPETKGGSKKIAKKGKDLKEEMDALVEDIDAVLEENAEEFVKNYVQRGGQ